MTTPRRIRVLVVDDSVALRRLISDALGSDASLEVTTAAGGALCMSRLPQIQPDLVILDVEMPDLSGLETLREIRRDWPRLPVIMFSGLTTRSAENTLEALSRGANDYVPKPSGAEGPEHARRMVREALVPKIHFFTGYRPPPSSSTEHLESPVPRHASAIVAPILAPRKTERVDLVAIGTSTGGPDALAAVLSSLISPLPVPMVIVQHMPPVFTKSLAERLTRKCSFPIHEARDGDLLVPGMAWLAPGDFHMMVARDGAELRLRLNQAPPESSCRPAVDVLFRSLPQHYGNRVLAVVMTGMGQDGLRGAQAIRAAGGQIVVQDRASSVVWGMPGFIAGAGLADKVVPLDQIAPEIDRRVAWGRSALPVAVTTKTPLAGAQGG